MKGRTDEQYTTFERLVSVLLSYRLAKQGTTSTGKTIMGRSALTDWDMFILGAASKLVATGITYPYVSYAKCAVSSADLQIVVKSRLVRSR